MRTEATSSWLDRFAVGVAGLLVVLGQIVMPATGSATERVALVVGNAAYTHIGQLPNPGNDAADLSAALERLDFEVTTALDVGRADLNDELRAFTRRSVGADISLVFYAGHGLEMDGVNYVLPVDARLERDTDVRYEALSLDDLLAATTGAALRVVILDACRDNPLAREIQRTVASRSISRGSFGELDESLLGDETLVAYAAAAGTTAADGQGRNSPYTAALLEYLEQPLEIAIVFRRIRTRVLQRTRGRQRPHEYASLLGEHYLATTPAPALVPVVATSSNEALVEQDTLFWRSIVDSTNVEDFGAYLRQFPTGIYAPLATSRMELLRSEEGDRDPVPIVSRLEAGDLGSGNAKAASDPPSRPTMPRPSTTGSVSRAAELTAVLGRALSTSASDENGWTDLHYAAAFGLSDVVRQLLEQGAYVNARLRNDGKELSVQLQRTLRRPLEGTFDKWTRDGEAPLHIAATVGSRAVTVVLLNYAARVNARTEFQWTPLHYAAATDALEVAEALLASGANIDARSLEYTTERAIMRTPLEVAERASSTRVAALLRARRGGR